MKKLKEIFVLHHSFPESAEAQREAEKYRAQGYEVFVFHSRRPRSFTGWSIAQMVPELFKLEHFTRSCQELRFSGQAVLHAKLELDALRCILQEFIPRRPFRELPIRTIVTLSCVKNFVIEIPKENE